MRVRTIRTRTLLEEEGGLVWGFVDGLKQWKALEEYEAAAHPLSRHDTDWRPDSAYWSPFPDEEHIIYGVYRPDKTVSKLNTDTGQRTSIIGYDPGDGTDVRNARSFGWTADKTLIVNFQNEEWSSGGFEIDVQKRTSKRYRSRSSDASAEGRRWPTLGHGHGDRSPGRRWIVSYWSGKRDYQLRNIQRKMVVLR